ncbi:hypothetical protein TUM4641_32970 [Shewanella morhuae]|nr:hypothetical protein TUM4641_32970 [Shewanella morhuae]
MATSAVEPCFSVIFGFCGLSAFSSQGKYFLILSVIYFNFTVKVLLVYLSTLTANALRDLARKPLLIV